MELIDEGLVHLDVEASTKEEVISLLADSLDCEGRLEDRDQYVLDVLDREKEFSTSIGFGVATPHAKADSVRVASLGFARLARPLLWGEDEVSMVFQIAVPLAEAGERHLQILASISRRLIHEDFRTRLAAAKTAKEVLELLAE